MTTTFVAAGNWTATHAGPLDRLVPVIPGTKQTGGRVAIDVSGIEQLDTLGAWLLERLSRRCRLDGQEPAFVGVPDDFKGLLERVHDVNRCARPARATGN